MIELPRRTAHGAGSWTAWFPSGRPGPGALTGHVRRTGVGRVWADRPQGPRAAAVGCAGYVLLGGDPDAVDPGGLAPLAHSYVTAPDRFLPVLAAAFDRIVPWERMVWVGGEPATAPPPDPAVTVRPLTRDDAWSVRELGPAAAWIGDSWGGPLGLAASGHCWGAFRDGRPLSLACTYFLGDPYEDIAVVTVPGERRRGLASACVGGLCADIAARGRTPSWTCSRDNEPSRRLAAKAGFRLVREYVHYAVGAPAAGASSPPPRGIFNSPYVA
ncbi:GNAT family N-acetyltransferase [Streptomyces olivoreticuli]